MSLLDSSLKQNFYRCTAWQQRQIVPYQRRLLAIYANTEHASTVRQLQNRKYLWLNFDNFFCMSGKKIAWWLMCWKNTENGKSIALFEKGGSGIEMRIKCIQSLTVEWWCKRYRVGYASTLHKTAKFEYIPRGESQLHTTRAALHSIFSFQEHIANA